MIADRKSGALLMLLDTLILAYGSYILSYLVPEAGDIWEPAKYAGLIALSAWIVWGILALWKKNANHHLLPIALFIVSVGWLEIYHLGLATGEVMQGPRQAIFTSISLGVFLFIAVCLRDYHILGDYKYVWLVVGLAIQFVVMLFGTTKYGATLWITFGNYSVQPVEFVKIMIVIFFAAFLRQFSSQNNNWFKSEEKRVRRRALISLGIGMAAAEFTLVIQRDLGMALLLFGIFISMFYVTSNRKDILACTFLLSSLGAYFCWKYFDHVQERVNNWLDPFCDYYDKGHQMCQAIFTLGNAGLDGTGLGLGGAHNIPIVINDFTFVAIVEEFGIFGASALIVAFILLAAHYFYVALKVKDEFGTILVTGLASMFAWQSIINMLGVTKSIPMTGIALPFVSAGGTSMVSCFVILSLIWVIDACDGGVSR
ncbi:FtsW/RodA/SpoVE family cell cycle protein [bacterium]|nr:FtsW/RodA/SpoVE family cell cycle protein [bacterium]